MSGNNKLLRIVGIAVFILLINNCNVFAQLPETPIDIMDEVHVYVYGYNVLIFGDALANNIPSIEDLLIITDPSDCGFVDIAEEWDCGNPIYRFWYKVLHVSFNTECNDELCISIKGNPQEYCFNNPDNIFIKADIIDICENSVKGRYIDIDEPVLFKAKIYYDEDDQEDIPHLISGHVTARNITQSISLLEEDDYNSCRVFISDIYTPREFTGSEIHPFWEMLKFTASYGRRATTHANVKKVSLAVDSVFYEHAIPIRNTYRGMTGCLPYGSNVTFNLKMKINNVYRNWPFCVYAKCTAIGSIDDYEHFTLAGNIDGDDNMLSMVNSDYWLPTDGPVDGDLIELPTYWKAYLNNGDERIIPGYTPLRIYNGVDAQPAIAYNVPDDMAINVNDTITVIANPLPDLDDETGLIHYYWQWSSNSSVTEDNDAGFVYGHSRFNKFYANAQGIYYIKYNANCNYPPYNSPYSDPIAITVLPKLVIDTPVPNEPFYITEVPEMPEIKCRAYFEGIPEDDQSGLIFNWKLSLEWAGNAYTKSGSVTGINYWTVDFGEDFRGGLLTAEVTTTYNGDEYTCTLDAANNNWVLGRNPAPSVVIDYLNDGYDNADKARQAEVIGYKESNYQQFADDGKPLVSRDNGVGIMQLTNPAATIQQTWNWKANVDGGKAILAEKWRASNRWFTNQMNGPVHYPEPTSRQRLLDTYCRYNGDRYFSVSDSLYPGHPCYRKNVMWRDSCGTCLTGYPEADFNKIEKKCMQSGCCYADRAIIIHYREE